MLEHPDADMLSQHSGLPVDQHQPDWDEDLLDGPPSPDPMTVLAQYSSQRAFPSNDPGSTMGRRGGSPAPSPASDGDSSSPLTSLSEAETAPEVKPAHPVDMIDWDWDEDELLGGEDIVESAKDDGSPPTSTQDGMSQDAARSGPSGEVPSSAHEAEAVEQGQGPIAGGAVDDWEALYDA